MTPLDLIVIGGGITGAGVARLAARNGLSVALLERGDLASGASSATSHMLHGGLRYLEHGHFSLVREALVERAAILRMAPTLARPARFLVPFYRRDRRPGWMIRLGLGLYDAFAGRARLAPHATVDSPTVRSLEPDLSPNGLLGAALYSDAVMDDARITLAVARDAVGHGAQVHTYTEVVGARPEGEAVEVLARDTLTGAPQRWTARAVVNATGAWSDRVRRLLLCALAPGRPDPPPLLRPSRGIHLVYPRLTRSHALVLAARADGRVFFVVPFADHSLVGTTESETSSPPEAESLRPSVEEIRYLRAELKRVLPAPADSPIVAVTAGLRPLTASAGEIGSASREHELVEDGQVLTLVGGKYTTFRVMARDALARVLPRVGRPAQRVRDETAPLPRPLDPDRGVEALTEHAVDHEFARRVEDVVRRRTRLWLSPDRGRVAAPMVAATLARRLGWAPERVREELQSFHATLEDEERLVRRAREEA